MGSIFDYGIANVSNVVHPDVDVFSYFTITSHMASHKRYGIDIREKHYQMLGQKVQFLPYFNLPDVLACCVHFIYCA